MMTKIKVLGEKIGFGDGDASSTSGDEMISTSTITNSSSAREVGENGDSCVDASGGEGCGSATVPKSPPAQKSSSSKRSEDVHSCLEDYKRLVREYTTRLAVLAVVTADCTALAQDFSLKIRQMFVLSMQLICHETTSMCTSAAELMHQTSNNFQSWNNAMTEQEFEEQKHISEDMSQHTEDIESDDAGTEEDVILGGGGGCSSPPPHAPLLLQSSLLVTTLHDAKRINQDELDGEAPAVHDATTTLFLRSSSHGWSRRKSSTGVVRSELSKSSGDSGGGIGVVGSSAVTAALHTSLAQSTKSKFSSIFSLKGKDKSKDAKSAPATSEGGGDRDSESGSGSGGSAAAVSAETHGEDEEALGEEEVAEGGGSVLHRVRAGVSCEGVLHLWAVSSAAVEGREPPLQSLVLEVSSVRDVLSLVGNL